MTKDVTYYSNVVEASPFESKDGLQKQSEAPNWFNHRGGEADFGELNKITVILKYIGESELYPRLENWMDQVSPPSPIDVKRQN